MLGFRNVIGSHLTSTLFISSLDKVYKMGGDRVGVGLLGANAWFAHDATPCSWWQFIEILCAWVDEMPFAWSYQ